MKVIDCIEIAEKIQLEYDIRQSQERNKIRITNLVYFNNQKFENKPVEYNKDGSVKVSPYVYTYWHNALEDVTAQYFMNSGLFPYKEGFIIDERLKIKGHFDILLYYVRQMNKDEVEFEPWALLEVKNYQKTNVSQEDKNHFEEQMLMYCTCLNVNRMYLVARIYGQVVVKQYDLDELDFAEGELLMTERLSDSMYVPHSPEYDNTHNDNALRNM